MRIEWKNHNNRIQPDSELVRCSFQEHNLQMAAFSKAHASAVLTNGKRTPASNLRETTEPFQLQNALPETGGCQIPQDVAEQWLFIPMKRVKLSSYLLN